MNKIIKECINDFLKKELVMEYNISDNEVIYHDITILQSLLEKFKEEFLTDIDIRHKNGEMVSRNEAIIKKTETDINNLMYDIDYFIKLSKSEELKRRRQRI
jgi:hypothetical protein